jgi:hypothetical protein
MPGWLCQAAGGPSLIPFPQEGTTVALSLEIFLNIVESSTPGTMAACALLSKGFQSAVEKILYRRLFVSFDTNPPIYDCVNSVLNDDSPWRGEAARELLLDLDDLDEPSCVDVQRFLESLPNLTCLEMRLTRTTMNILKDLNATFRVRHLWLDAPIETRGLLAFLFQQTEVERAILNLYTRRALGLGNDDAEKLSSPALLPKLKALDVRMERAIAKAFMEHREVPMLSIEHELWDVTATMPSFASRVSSLKADCRNANLSSLSKSFCSVATLRLCLNGHHARLLLEAVRYMSLSELGLTQQHAAQGRRN